MTSEDALLIREVRPHSVRCLFGGGPDRREVHERCGLRLRLSDYLRDVGRTQMATVSASV